MKIPGFAVAALTAATLNVHAQDLDSVRYVASTGTIVLIDSQHAEKQCRIEPKMNDAAPLFNWNKTVVILGSVEYVPVDSLVACAGGVTAVRRIPAKVGAVADVNTAKNLYLALDVVSTTPETYTATVAHLGSTRPVADFPGMYGVAKGKSRVEKESFSYDESSLGRISPDGRYVSADGSMLCGDDSYPGVWDLERKQKVIREDGCESLFKAH
ncbi:hypothetical protein [Paraburkholderia sp. BR10882]|uniref:hypothetical protein n=1 Tax=unclassified Paraburkholderia TaxID=2615204 RepID=UPI0034CEB314